MCPYTHVMIVDLRWTLADIPQEGGLNEGDVAVQHGIVERDVRPATIGKRDGKHAVGGTLQIVLGWSRRQ